MQRYIRNFTAISPEENAHLEKCQVCVVGCGGLGGYVVEMLGRLGVGRITVVDGDVFEESNLNRQLLSDVESLGQNKAQKAKERMKLVNPLIAINAVNSLLTRANFPTILAKHDVLVDALDNAEGRLLLQEAGEKLNIPLVHGAIAGWYGQVTTIFPYDKTLDNIYGPQTGRGLEKELGNPAFTPALVASLQVSEVVKVLLNRGCLLRHKLLTINLLSHEYEIIEFSC